MGAERPAPPRRPDLRPQRLRTSSWFLLLGATVVAVAAIALFPRSGGDAPPLASLALIGAVIAGVTTAALVLIARTDLGLPWRIVIPLVVAFGMIAIVKFVLAPQGLYEVNAVRALDDAFGTVSDPAGAALTAAAVFALYAFGFSIVYRLGYGERAPLRRRDRGRDPPTIGAGTVFAGVVLVALAVAGGWVVVLVVLNAPRQYLEFVFSSGAGVVILAALAAAAILLGSTFRRLGRAPGAIVEVGAVVTLFWLGLGFLALYHVLWTVYVLVLGSIWPLKTVTPK